MVNDADALNYCFGGYIIAGLAGKYPPAPRSLRAPTEAIFTKDQERANYARKLYGKKD